MDGCLNSESIRAVSHADPKRRERLQSPMGWGSIPSTDISLSSWQAEQCARWTETLKQVISSSPGQSAPIKQSALQNMLCFQKWMSAFSSQFRHDLFVLKYQQNYS